MHCFHYLIPLAKQGNYAIVANAASMDYDPLVVKLNKDISAIEEAMGAALQQHKFQYIFEGVCVSFFVVCVCAVYVSLTEAVILIIHGLIRS